MAPTADPGALEAAARALQRQAHLLQQGGAAGAFSRQAGASPWKGQAADRFRHTVSQDKQEAMKLAQDLLSIADMILAGAAKIRAYRAKMAALQNELNSLQQKDKSLQQKESSILQQAQALRP